MGRKSLAETIYDNLDDYTDENHQWVVVYDFKAKANPRFWGNLHRLSKYSLGSRLLQHSVYCTSSERVARAAVMLVRSYPASVELFKGEFIDCGQSAQTWEE